MWGAGVSGFQTGIQWLQVHDTQDKICLHQTRKRTNAIEQLRKADFDSDLVLDIFATFSSMKNKNLLAGVCTVDRPIKMCTNTGARCVTECGEMLGVKVDRG